MNLSLVPVIAVFLNGLLAGTFIGSSLVEHAARTLSGSAWLAYKQAKEVVFGAVMPGFLAATILVSAVAAVLQPGRGWFVAATAMLLGILAITVVVHLPINKLVQGTAPGADLLGWSEHRRRWRQWNWLRCALAVAAFAAALAGYR